MGQIKVLAELAVISGVRTVYFLFVPSRFQT
jgi:hypothetical protein